MIDLVQGIGAAIAADISGEKLKALMAKKEISDLEKFFVHLPKEWDELLVAVKAIAAQSGHSPIPETVNLWGFPSTYQVHMRGRGHLSLFCLADFSLYANVMQLGFITLSAKAGWNTLDLTDGSELALPAATPGPLGVLLLYADTNLGTAIGVA